MCYIPGRCSQRPGLFQEVRMKKTKSPKKPEHSTGKPCTVIPKRDNSADFQDKEVLKMPSPRSDLYRNHF